jgi:hypothetical protein
MPFGNGLQIAIAMMEKLFSSMILLMIMFIDVLFLKTHMHGKFGNSKTAIYTILNVHTNEAQMPLIWL